ncbi:hypothetical protein DPEC_G00016710 [Dallia pectoralis]|uniref:Uncharacterized protein n=1 Tax=Dallia pectoralis TaxID=75939 RepID=A0ACC2HN91_DALPE|nr:hypothetical protein DPEC_G00016710 [Dallia pectoralis]
MSEIVSFRVFLNELLTAAAVEIFGAFDKMLVECMIRQELDSLQSPVSEEQVSLEHQDWTPCLGQLSVSEGDDPLHKAKLTEYTALNRLKSSKLQMFSVFLNNILTTSAAEDIFGSVKKIVVKYREENDHLRRQLQLTPDIQLCRLDSLQSPVSEEQVSLEHQDWTPCLGQLSVSEGDDPLHKAKLTEYTALNRLKSSKLQMFSAFLNDILTTSAAEDIFGSVKKIVVKYREENDHLRRLMQLTPEIKLCRLDSLPFPISKEKVPPEEQDCEQERSPSLGQENPETMQIKEEQEELRISQGEEQNQGVEPDIIEFIFCPSVKREYNSVTHLKNRNQLKLFHKREKSQSSGDCGRSISQMGTLTKQKLTHTGEKSHSSEDYEKSFCQEESLTEDLLLTVLLLGRPHSSDTPESLGRKSRGYGLNTDIKPTHLK